MFFDLVYAGQYRHQGLYLVFILFLYWLFIESINDEAMARAKRMLFNAGYVALLILIMGNVATTRAVIAEDLSGEESSSKAFGEFLNTSRTLREAIIIPEPDFFMESLPYYAKNRIYLPREHRFGTTVSWTTEANARLSLGELLSVARDIKTQYRVPVLIVFWPWDRVEYLPGEKKYSYNKVLEWNAAQVADFSEATVLLANFNSAIGDEKYRVYAITDDRSKSEATGVPQASQQEVAPVPVELSGLGAIVGFVFEDKNRDGVFGQNDVRMAGETVILENPSRLTFIRSVTTGADSGFRFDHLPVGPYRVSVKVPEGFERTSDDSFVVTVAADGTAPEARFGVAK